MEPVELSSSVEISREDVVSTLQAFETQPDPDNIYDRLVYRGDGYVFVALTNADELEPEDLPPIIQKLGDVPRSFVVIDIGRTEESERLAVEIAAKFAERWPCVVDNLMVEEDGGKVFSREEILGLRESGKGFWPQYVEAGA